MPYIIDTDWLIDYLAEEPLAVALVEKLAGEGITMSIIISYMESYQGVLRSSEEGTRRRLDSILDGVPVLPFSLAVARRCAAMREHLRKAGKRVSQRALDLVIAATAIEYNLTLVTRNAGDFSDIPDLKLYQS